MKALRSGLREPGLVALAALQGVVFWRALFVETFFFRDLHLLFFFQRVKVAGALSAGHLPLWDPTLHGGQPLLANVNNTALYPGNLLYLVFPAVAAFNLEIVLHLALAGMAAYALARTLGLASQAALVTALVYEFCGPALSLVNVQNRLLAYPWTPVILLFWHLFLVERRARWFAAAACAAALQVLAGYPELTALTFALLAAWSLPAAASALSRRRRLLLLAGLAGLAAGLAAPQILPTLWLLKHTARGAGLGAASALAWSVDPRRLPELVLPGWFGRVDTLSDADYWGRSLEHLGFPYLLSLTFGAAALLLSVAGAGGAVDKGPAVAQRRAAAAFAGAALVLSLGRNLPEAGALVAALPIRLFRFPVKFVCAAALPVGVLAGAGAARIAAAARPLRLRFALGAALAAAALACLAAAEEWNAGFSSWVASTFFAAPSAAVPQGAVAGSLAHAALVSGALALLVVLCRERTSAAALVVIVAADLLAGGRRLNPTAPRALLAEPPPILQEVRRAVGSGSLYRVPERRTLEVSAQSNDVVWLAKRNLETLAGYTAAGFGIPVPFHADFDSLARSEVMRVTAYVDRLPWAQRVPVLAAAGVSAVLANEPVTVPGLELAAGSPSGVFLYRIGGATPPARLVEPTGSGRVVSDRAERPGLRRVEVDSASRATLILTTPFWEGWSARIDGGPGEVRPANVFMQSVDVPAGHRVVRLAYWPPGLTPGCAVFAATILLAAAAARARGARRRRESAASVPSV